MSKKTTRKALFGSVMALVLCVAMLVGSTFAWFSDSVTTGQNIIQSGNLDMVVSYKPYGAENTEWTEVTADDPIFNESALYEPGYTEAVWLKIENVGSLAFKYSLDITVYDEQTSTNVMGDEFSLADYVIVYTGMSVADYEGFESFYNSRESLLTNFNWNEVNLSEDKVEFISNNVAYSKNDPDYSDYSTVYVPVVIHMPETVGNEANHKTGVAAPWIKLGLSAVATQVPHEEDSFGSDYDADADAIPQAIVTNPEIVNEPMLIIPRILEGFNNPQEMTITLDEAFTFNAPDDENTVKSSPYKDWLVDYFVSINEPVEANPSDAEDPSYETGIIMAGQYTQWSDSWFGFKVPSIDVTEPVGLLGLMCTGGVSNWTYEEIVTGVGTFNCGVVNDATYNTGKVMTVELRLMNPADPLNDYIVISSTDHIFD